MTTHTTAPSPGSPPTTLHPVPGWAERTAHLLPLLLLPQCLWRLPFALDFDMGMHDQGGMPDWWIAIPYVLGLSLTTEALALLCFGLVRHWGEVAPAWLPVIGGRPVRPYAALVPATLGGLAATAFWAPLWLSWLGLASDGPGYDNAWWEALATVCVAPGTFFGPLVLVLAYGYWARRCRPSRRAG